MGGGCATVNPRVRAGDRRRRRNLTGGTVTDQFRTPAQALARATQAAREHVQQAVDRATQAAAEHGRRLRDAGLVSADDQDQS
jgi:hypothetical protein